MCLASVCRKSFLVSSSSSPVSPENQRRFQKKFYCFGKKFFLSLTPVNSILLFYLHFVRFLCVFVYLMSQPCFSLQNPNDFLSFSLYLACCSFIREAINFICVFPELVTFFLKPHQEFVVQLILNWTVLRMSNKHKLLVSDSASNHVILCNSRTMFLVLHLQFLLTVRVGLFN